MWQYNDYFELYHHGILGQKWGVRRFQNKDGTLTSAGKARYRVGDIKSDIKSAVKEKSGDFERTRRAGQAVEDTANELGEHYRDYFNSVKPTPESRKRIAKHLKEQLGDGCDDEDLFRWVLEEAAEQEIFGPSMPGSLKKKRNEFDSLQESYWNKVKDVSETLLKKYGEEPVKGSSYSAKQLANRLVLEELGTYNPSYIYRHFDDYWVNDTDEHYNAINRLTEGITMDKYNRRSGDL